MTLGIGFGSAVAVGERSCGVRGGRPPPPVRRCALRMPPIILEAIAITIPTAIIVPNSCPLLTLIPKFCEINVANGGMRRLAEIKKRKISGPIQPLFVLRGGSSDIIRVIADLRLQIVPGAL